MQIAMFFVILSSQNNIAPREEWWWGGGRIPTQGKISKGIARLLARLVDQHGQMKRLVLQRLICETLLDSESLLHCAVQIR